jgi:hypothetical protein
MILKVCFQPSSKLSLVSREQTIANDSTPTYNCRLSKIGPAHHWGYDRYTHTDKMHFDHKIPMLKSYIKCLALKMNASAKTSRNRHIKKLESALMVVDPRGPMPIHILR